MTTKDDGGPAWPWYPDLSNGDIVQPAYSGMTLRDWFAGQALAGLLAAADLGNSPHDLSCACFSVADAMLAARQGGAK